MSVKERPEQIVELRCPLGPKALLAKVVQLGDRPRMAEGNLMELSCRDCARTARKTNPSVKRILHRFNVLGDLVESVVQED